MKPLACALAVHPDGAPLRLAMTEGHSLPPTTPFDNDPAQAAARHLFDTLALETRSAIAIGTTTKIGKMHFVLCRIAPPVRQVWKHLQPDGTLVTARWYALDNLPRNDTLDWIRATL